MGPSFGIRIFSGASIDELTDTLNTFLAGDGTMANRKKQVVHPPAFSIAGSTFYVVLTYAEFGN